MHSPLKIFQHGTLENSRSRLNTFVRSNFPDWCGLLHHTLSALKHDCFLYLFRRIEVLMLNRLAMMADDQTSISKRLVYAIWLGSLNPQTHVHERQGESRHVLYVRRRLSRLAVIAVSQ